MQLKLAQFSGGRILLHLLCWSRTGRVRWHCAGIARELFPARSLPMLVADRLTLRTMLLVAGLLSAIS